MAENRFNYNPKPSAERNPLAGLGRSTGDQAASMDWAQTNGADARYHLNLAMNIGFTPEMYAYMASEYQRQFPGGLQESEAKGFNKDTGAINFYRTSHPYAIAREMADKGLPLGDSPEFQEYIQRTQRDAPDRVDWSFLDGYQPNKELPMPTGLKEVLPYWKPSSEGPITQDERTEAIVGDGSTVRGPSFGYIPEDARGPNPTESFELTPGGPGSFIPGRGNLPGMGAFNPPEIEFAAPPSGPTDIPISQAPQGDAMGVWNQGRPTDAFYDSQLSQLIRQRDAYQQQAAEAAARRAEAQANPPAPDLSWDWYKGGLPDVVVGGNTEASYDWAEGYGGDMTNQELFDAFSPNISQGSRDWLEQNWLATAEPSAQLGKLDPNTFAETAQGFGDPAARNAWQEALGQIYDYSPAAGAGIPVGYASPIAGYQPPGAGQPAAAINPYSAALRVGGF